MGPAGLGAEPAPLPVHPQPEAGARREWQQGMAAGIGSREGPVPVLAVRDTWLSLVSRSGQGIVRPGAALLLSQPQSPLQAGRCSLAPPPWAAVRIGVGSSSFCTRNLPIPCCPGLSHPSALEKRFFPGTRVSGPAKSNGFCPLC